MRFDRDIYFNYVREVLFEGALEQVHVDGQNLILATFENQYGGTLTTAALFFLSAWFRETAKPEDPP